MRPTALFDLDGTLVDTAPDLTTSLNVCLMEAGMEPASVAENRAHAGHGSRIMLIEAYHRANRPLGEEELERQLARLLAHYEANIAALSVTFPGAIEAMDRLESAGYTLAVCTNKYERFAVKLLDELGLGTRFAAICGGDSFSGRKPDPVHILGTIERAGGDRRAALMIGDTSTDTDAAEAAGIPSILVYFGHFADARAKATATRVIESFEHLDAALADSLIRRATP